MEDPGFKPPLSPSLKVGTLPVCLCISSADTMYNVHLWNEWTHSNLPDSRWFSLGLLCSRLSKIQIWPYHWLVKRGNPLSYRNWRALKALSQCFSNCGLWLTKSLKSEMESMEECIAREWGKYCLGNICVCWTFKTSSSLPFDLSLPLHILFLHLECSSLALPGDL